MEGDEKNFYVFRVVAFVFDGDGYFGIGGRYGFDSGERGGDF